MKITAALNTRCLTLSSNEALTSADVRWLLTRTKKMSECDADEVANLLFDSLAELLELENEDAAA